MSDSVYRVTEVIGTSTESWEAAAKNAVATAGQTVRDLRVGEATRFDVTIEVEELSLAEWNRMLAVHLTGTFLVCRAALPRLRAAGGGAIVNLASVAALLARPSLGVYAAAKGGIISFSRQLTLDAAADNVRVNVIAPGSVRTPMTAPVYAEPGADDGRPAAPHAIQPRLGEPEELAAPICFLLSDEAGFFTASLVVADGGATAL